MIFIISNCDSRQVIVKNIFHLSKLSMLLVLLPVISNIVDMLNALGCTRIADITSYLSQREVCCFKLPKKNWRENCSIFQYLGDNCLSPQGFIGSV